MGTRTRHEHAKPDNKALLTLLILITKVSPSHIVLCSKIMGSYWPSATIGV